MPPPSPKAKMLESLRIPDGEGMPSPYNTTIRYSAKQSFSLMCYSLLGILNPRMAPLAAVSVISPPMTWFLLMSRVAYTGSVAPG